jgi:hypothetical protein
MKWALALFLLVVCFSSGCNKDDQVIQPILTIEDRINAERPMNTVVVTNPSAGNWTFSQLPGTGNPLTDAYAERGYLIVVSNSKHFFNLSLATEIIISANRVDVRY